MKTKAKLSVFLFAVLIALTSCGTGASSSPEKVPASSSSSAAFRADSSSALPQEALSSVFASFFQQQWPAVEGAADAMALPEGTVFFADMDGDGTPELFLTYSTGGGKQTGLLAYNVSGETPKELGSAYLAVAPLGSQLEFSLWEEGGQRVLYTQGELPVGAADPTHYHIESFLSLSDGRLVLAELNYSETEGRSPVYYRTPQSSETVSAAEYEALRCALLPGGEPLETIDAGEPLDFLEDLPAFETAVREAWERWTQGHG